MNSTQCAATTTKGKQCKNLQALNSEFCATHAQHETTADPVVEHDDSKALDVSNPLVDNAMLVEQSISKWTARKYDRAVSEEVAESHEAKSDSGRFNKALVPKEALAEINRIAREARDHHYRTTLPWSDKGARILTVACYDEYVLRQDDYSEQMRIARRAFADAYLQHVDDARANLGTMFREDDYPDASSIADKFSVSYRIKPVEDPASFRVRLEQSEVDKLRARIQSDIDRQVADAQSELFSRLQDAVSHVVDRLQTETLSEDGRRGKAGAVVPRQFRDSLISNLRELVNIAPRMNVTNDPRVIEFCARAHQMLDSVGDPDELRPSSRVYEPTLREQVAREASELAQSFAGYFGGDA